MIAAETKMHVAVQAEHFIGVKAPLIAAEEYVGGTDFPKFGAGIQPPEPTNQREVARIREMPQELDLTYGILVQH
jgi:hypothetical protein